MAYLQVVSQETQEKHWKNKGQTKPRDMTILF